MHILPLAACALTLFSFSQAQEAPGPEPATLPELCAQWLEDRQALGRLYPFSLSEMRAAAIADLSQAWLERLQGLDFDALPRRNQIDYLLLLGDIQHAQSRQAIEAPQQASDAEFLGFAPPLVALLEARSQRDLPDARGSASVLHEATQAIEAWQSEWKAKRKDDPEGEKPSPSQMKRAAGVCNRIRRSVDSWYKFGAEYDPLFTFWCEAPWGKLDKAMRGHAKFLEETIGEIDPKDEDRLLGKPIGREALLAELHGERIAYSPEELIAIAETEFSWCDDKRAAAANAMGLEGDWRAAQEKVRSIQVPPGGQPAMIRELADEAVRFFEERELLTIPKAAKHTWRMQMMSPERQRFSPYFTGGEVISIAYPTSSMDHDAKLQSMRGNNRHFSRATVHHELIPGHHLQGYMARRWNTHRGMFRTAFLVEGWALYWELRLWDLDFAQSPEDEIGMLFWRSHRCARILFSLNYHLGNWSAEECVDFLVERVGHDRRNAKAEVRRSIQGGYGPLYQVAYMIGGMQLVSLHQELVVDGPWEEKAFHDTILRQGSIPVELIRAAMLTTPIKKDMPVRWRFAD